MKRLAFALLVARASITAAQTQAGVVADFIQRARAGTERFKDISVAVAESYVKVGPDFPAMGEHWVNGELIMRGEVNPARPAILTYMTVNGEPTLTGVVYAVALAPGDVPPLLPPGAGWHDHVGSVDEESLLMHHMEHAADDVRLVVMHAWIWQPNPAGMFVTDNWSLPFARLRLDGPSAPPSDAARAIALLSGADHYFDRLFSSVGQLTDDERERMSAVVEKYRAQLQEWWERRDVQTGSRLSESDVAMLKDTWSRLEMDLQPAVGPLASQRLARLFSETH